MGSKCYRWIDGGKVNLANRKSAVYFYPIAALRKCKGDIIFLEVMVSEKAVSPNLILQQFDAMAPILFADYALEPVKNVLDFIIVD